RGDPTPPAGVADEIESCENVAARGFGQMESVHPEADIGATAAGTPDDELVVLAESPEAVLVWEVPLPELSVLAFCVASRDDHSPLACVCVVAGDGLDEGPVGEAREAVRGTSRASRLRVFRQDGRSRLDRTGGTDPPPIHGQVPKLVPSRDRIDEHSVVRPVDHGLSARAAILARSVLRLETGDPSDPLRSYRVRTHGRMVVRTIATGRDVHAVQ